MAAPATVHAEQVQRDLDRWLARLFAGESLGEAGAHALMGLWMAGAVDAVRGAAILGVLAGRRPRPDELAGFVRAMREHATPVPIDPAGCVDTAGTGGDGLGTFNLSTAAALVVAGAGVRVPKHGNVSVSSRCGSADVLRAAGVPIELGPEAAARALDAVGFAFLLAPRYHPSMRHVAPVRRALGVRTVFNLLGPLCNPAGVRRQVVGAYAPRAAACIADVLAHLGVERAAVVHGAGGADELTLAGPSRLWVVEADGTVHQETVDPAALGLGHAPVEALAGGAPADNARLLEAVLQGSGGPLAEATCLNAAVALWVAGAASSVADGLALALDTVASGRALAVLEAARGMAA